jgi:hypothetical protein
MSVREQIETSARTEAMREALETVLQSHFGAISEKTRDAIATANLATLRAWHSFAIRAASLAAIGIVPEDSVE